MLRSMAKTTSKNEEYIIYSFDLDSISLIYLDKRQVFYYVSVSGAFQTPSHPNKLLLTTRFKYGLCLGLGHWRKRPLLACVAFVSIE